MTYPDALSYLGQTRRFGMKLGLESMRELARSLDNPQEKLRFIHLAGTNGKGSTAAFCESCLRAAGFRVGLYTSPHLVSVRERIQVNRQPISEADFAEGMAVVRKHVDKQVDHEITFFELMTALALWYFAREKVDWVVWETGLGGRLDATNIVTPKVCIITNIGLDHQQYLGQTLAEIAAEKAGIIKPGVPVVSAVEQKEARGIVEAKVKELGSWLALAPRDMNVEVTGLRGKRQIVRIDGHEYPLRLIGRHQAQNAACAIAAMDSLHHRKESVIVRGLESASWPGRFEILSEKPLVVLDGAHNPAGTAMLVETWRAFLAARFGWSEHEINGRAHLVFASVADKDISEMAQLLRPLAKNVSLVRLANERGADPALLAPAFTGLPVTCYDSVSAVWQNITSLPESITLITGSLFLVGEMLARRQGSAEEYRLNEHLEKFTAIR
jgi:dihydrofolate synthase/folylpolyglutamate synthase